MFVIISSQHIVVDVKSTKGMKFLDHNGYWYIYNNAVAYLQWGLVGPVPHQLSFNLVTN